MNDQMISQQLKKLRQVQPDQQWVDQQRSVIMAQVYNGQAPAISDFSYWSNLWLSISDAFKQPGLVVSLILITTLIGGGITSHWASRHTKPGDSLYIAKQINDRARLLAVSFDRVEQDRLKLSMASQRASEMSEVDPTNAHQAEAISREFKQTVNQVKDRLEKVEAKAAQQQVLAKKNVNSKTEPIASTTDKELVGEDSSEASFGIASGLDREDQGIEVNEVILATPSPRQILEEAEALFDQQDYTAVIDKLEMASQLIE